MIQPLTKKLFSTQEVVMYQEIFDFSGRPFTMAPYVKHFFEGGPVKESFDQVTESISRDAGPAIVVGEHGTGKTLLLTLLSEQYQQKFKVISLSCGPMSARRDLLQAILFELKQPYRDLSEGELRLSLIDFIKPAANCPNGVLLLIDDAQALTSDLVDELRLITNFVRDGVPRVRLVFCGTGRFEEILTEPKLESFNQRISTRCFLGNLTREQTQAYVHEHIARVGGNATTMFDSCTTEAIHEATSGCPRFINQLAEQCMIYAATHGSMIVEPNMVAPAWAQVQGLPTADPNAPVPTDSNDENWTVIEFGTLDDDEDFAEDSDQTSAAADSGIASNDEPGKLLNDSVNVEITGESMDAEATEPEPTHVDSQWGDVGSSDPFVAHESVSDQEELAATEAQTDEASVSAETEDGYTYEPLAASIEEDQIQATAETSSIPIEFGDLAQDQEDTWAAAGFAADTQADELSAQLDTSAEHTSSEPTEEETEGVSESQSLADSALPAVPAIAAAVAASMANPFSEAFDSEEPVSTEFNDQLAEQNVSSMSVTGEQLDQLSPPNEDLPNNTGIPVVSLADEASPTPETFSEEPAPAFETTVPVDSEEYTADQLNSVFGSMENDQTAADNAAGPTADMEPVDGSSEPDLNVAPETDDDESNFHEHNTQQPTADIQQQADEILSSIRTPEPAQNDSIDEGAKPASEPCDTDPAVAQDNVEISEAQRILAEILEHKQLLSEQVTPPATESHATNMAEFPQTLPIQHSYSTEAPAETSDIGYNAEPTSQAQNHSDPTSPNSTYGNDGAAVSIGRAERMNYEKLFEQLRDQGDKT
jgi:type II secretory pathway predicted ATPase ExeA